jgi:hypothetical protein
MDVSTVNTVRTLTLSCICVKDDADTECSGHWKLSLCLNGGTYQLSMDVIRLERPDSRR